MIVLSRNRYFLSCHEIICFFKPYSIGFSPWCHGYDYEYYTTTTRITAGAFKLAGVQYISELHSSRSSGAGNTIQSNRCQQGCLLQGLAGVVNQGDVELMARLKNT